DYSNELQTETVFPVPTNLIATIIDYQSVQLTWDVNCTFETGYTVERKEESSTFTEIADLSADTETYMEQGLTFGTDYTYRIQAYTNSNLSDYSEEVLTNINVAIDRDGNVYKVVKIGDQYWMAENLKVTHYRNGDAIPKVTDNNTWNYLTTGAYCIYDNDDSNADTYGSFYNWYAVNDSRGLAPAGWHIPTDAECQTLVDYCGGNSVAGGKLKSISGWYESGNGTNDYGLSVLPGGSRNPNGNYANLGTNAQLWSATEYGSSLAWYWALYLNSEIRRFSVSILHGFSVRCVKD
ncbi:MAG: fibronectin type III domain-containing protein, partial [Candidatus Marinimicrobia bacterium]|nr:fibronectin type III domain-containing protein [Candidatus Neomarinimicrobiota bacterium]